MFKFLTIGDYLKAISISFPLIILFGIITMGNLLGAIILTIIVLWLRLLVIAKTREKKAKMIWEAKEMFDKDKVSDLDKI